MDVAVIPYWMTSRKILETAHVGNVGVAGEGLCPISEPMIVLLTDATATTACERKLPTCYAIRGEVGTLQSFFQRLSSVTSYR